MTTQSSHLRPLVVLAILAVAGIALWPITRMGSAQVDATPANLASNVPEGVTLEELAAEVAKSLPGVPARLTMERLEFGADDDANDQSEERTTQGPELIYIEQGSITVCDDVNVCGLYDVAGRRELIIQKGSRYTLVPIPEQTATVIRLSLVPWYDGSPVAAGTVIVDSTIASLPAAPACMFLLRITVNPETTPVAHIHHGPVGFAEATGTITVGRERSIVGQLGPGGTPFVLPPDDPHYETNESADDASAWTFGIIDLSQPLYVPATATPDLSGTATATPTATSIGTNTATPTPLPIDCSVPTPTTTPTLTSTPTATLTPTPTPTP